MYFGCAAKTKAKKGNCQDQEGPQYMFPRCMKRFVDHVFLQELFSIISTPLTIMWVFNKIVNNKFVGSFVLLLLKVSPMLFLQANKMWRMSSSHHLFEDHRISRQINAVSISWVFLSVSVLQSSRVD
jgi:hypothetical protein